MGRPKRVFPNRLQTFNLMHTRSVKMYSGVEITALHLVKETPQYYLSLDSWAHCCSQFKGKKDRTKLDFNIPVLTDDDCINFLDNKAWHDWTIKEKDNPDMKETTSFLSKLFPNKKLIFFYELKSLIGAYCHGSFLRYDENGNIDTTYNGDIKNRKYYNFKYKGLFNQDNIVFPNEITNLFDKYRVAVDEDKKDSAYKEYRKVIDNYILKNYDLTNTFINVCKNSVCCPFAFSDATVEGYSYEHAGEIYFVVTPEAIYFETERHF